METSITKHKDVIAKKNRMEAIASELKQRFIGLDGIIGGVMSLVTAWLSGNLAKVSKNHENSCS